MSVPEHVLPRPPAERSPRRRRRRLSAPPRRRAAGFEQLESRFLLSAQSAATSHPTLVLHRGSDGSVPFATSSPNGLTPTQIRHAYGFDQVLIGGVQGDGTGQTIAIIDAYDDPTIVSDLHNFDAYWTANGYNLPDPPSFIRVAQNGSTNYPGTDPAGAGNANGTWEMETSLDVEWAHALAPNANILLVEATSPSNSNLMTAAVGYAKSQPNVSLITMSFGQGEFSGETSFDSLFTTPNGHIGITFLASTGDNGQPSGYPAFSPNVVAVGGTTLNVDGAGNYLGESGWSGSGGSVSTMESQPAYQNGVVDQFSTTARTNPDVAFDADPNTGVPVYDSWDFGISTPWEQFGGTSFSSPSWAALLAVADQARVAAGLTTLDGPSQTLPKLYALPAADFNDITSGNNGFAAGVGYDLVTGLGTPKAALVVNDLIGVYAVTSSTPANGAVVSTPPVDFAVTLTAPYAPSSVQADDLSVNGVTASSFTLTSATTVTFHYATSPISAQGLETMSIPAGTITRQTDGAPVAAFNASFRYDAVVIAVDGTTPANGSTVTLPLTSLAVHFNEAYAAASIGVNDLTLSQGSVSSFALTDSQTVTYNLTGINNSGTLTINMAAGAVTDAFGNPGAAYSGSLVLVKPPVAFPTPLAAVTPAGSLIYQNSTSGTITSGSSDTFTLSIAAGQTLTVLVTPASGLQAQLNVTGPGISSAASSASAGAPALLQTLAISATSTYSFIVGGLGGTTGSYTIQAYLNAVLSTATVSGASNHTLATAQNIDSSFVGLGGTAQRGAVMGTVTSSIGPDGFGYSGIAITPQFVDISGTGTATLVGVDDGNTRLRSNNLSGFTFKLYNTTYSSNFFINSNGMITFGSGLTGSASYTNTDLTNAPSQAIIAPLWDDWVITGGSQSAVYWQVQGSGASQRFIVQWNDVSAYQGAQTGQVTFEVILNADGTMIFNYQNLNSADFAAGGASATVGIKNSGTQGSNRLLVSFNSTSSPYVATGKSLEIGVGLTATATDFYAFTLGAGQTTTLAATGQKSATVSVSLENAQGATLASGSSPGGGSSVGSIVDNFVAPSAGTYYAVVTGTTGAPYSLVVNRDADFGTETNGSFATAQNIGAAKGVLGDILAAPASPTENWYSINVAAGSELLLQTITPGSATAQFTNNLVPRIELYSPSDVLLVSGQGAGNQSLSAVVNTTGAYRIRVFGANSTSGEYFVSASIDATPPTASITPISPDPRNGPLSQLQIVFNKPVTGVSLASFSLTSGGGPNLLTSAQTLTTSDNITYTLGNLGPLTNSDGNYSLSLVASPSITDSSGGYLASGAATTFIIDLTPPEVQGVFVSGIDWNSSFLTYLETSGLGTAQSGYQIPAGATQLSPLPWSNVTTLTIAFTEDVSIDAANAGLALIGSPDLPPPPSLAGAAFSYSHVTHTATWTLDSPLPENKYLLSIPAAAVMDALGSQLDGEWTNPNGSPDASQFPSGNGTAGGDFNFRFNVLPADVNQDGAVTGSDGNTLRNHLLEDTSSGSYSAFSDLNADGAITGLDGAIVRMNLLQSLPASDPQAPAGGNQALAVSGQATESANSARLVQPVGSAALRVGRPRRWQQVQFQ